MCEADQRPSLSSSTYCKVPDLLTKFPLLSSLPSLWLSVTPPLPLSLCCFFLFFSFCLLILWQVNAQLAYLAYAHAHMHAHSLRWCVTGDFKGDSGIDSLIWERRRGGEKARGEREMRRDSVSRGETKRGKGYGQDISVRNRGNFIILSHHRKAASRS